MENDKIYLGDKVVGVNGKTYRVVIVSDNEYEKVLKDPTSYCKEFGSLKFGNSTEYDVVIVAVPSGRSLPCN